MSGYKHGMHGTPIYKIWRSFRKRCKPYLQEKYPTYKGISYCEEWEDFIDFYKWAIENGFKEGLTLDRIDNSKGYCPDNCRFATIEEQARNKTNNIFLTWQGKTQIVTDWERELGWKRATLRERVKRGWTVEECFTIPITKSNRLKKRD